MRSLRSACSVSRSITSQHSTAAPLTLLLLEAGKRHLGARDVLLRVLQVLEERLLLPGCARASAHAPAPSPRSDRICRHRICPAPAVCSRHLRRFIAYTSLLRLAVLLSSRRPRAPSPSPVLLLPLPKCRLVLRLATPAASLCRHTNQVTPLFTLAAVYEKPSTWPVLRPKRPSVRGRGRVSMLRKSSPVRRAPLTEVGADCR
jgi:hypothetical protein